MISSCGTNNKKHIEDKDYSVDFQTIKTGVLHGAGEEGFSQSVILVSNNDELEEVKTRINAVNQEIEDDLIKGETFFNEHMLIFVFDRVRNTGGYTFIVSEITNKNDVLTVKALSNPPSDQATSIMTQPFHVLKLEKINTNVELEFIE